MPRNNNIISLVLVGVLALGSVACSRSVAQQRITEDDSRWDCRTMGNKVCGPTSTPTPAAKPRILCGAPTKKGTACKNRVKQQGDRCHLHKGAK